MIIVSGFQPLTIITKRSILDVAAALDPSLTPVKFLLLSNSSKSFFITLITFSHCFLFPCLLFPGNCPGKYMNKKQFAINQLYLHFLSFCLSFNP